jgi:hypothetical protein
VGKGLRLLSLALQGRMGFLTYGCFSMRGCGFVAQLEDAEDLLEEEGDVAPAEAAAVAKPATAQCVSPEFKAGAEAFALKCAQPSMRGGV